MKVHVDQVKCKSVGACVEICPEIFHFQAGSKKADVYSEDVPEQLEAKCRLAAQECPEDAVIIQE